MLLFYGRWFESIDGHIVLPISQLDCEILVVLGQDFVGTLVRGLEGGPPGISANEDALGLVQSGGDVRFDRSVHAG